MTAALALITVQALLGALDNLWHHEITERLPARRAARQELALHAVREGLYAFVFLALAWFEWHGSWVLLLGGVFAAEVGVTLADFIVEDRTRRLPRFERVLHTILAINFGAVLAVLAPTFRAWWSEPTALVATDHGLVSWLFTVFALIVALWSLRNALAVLRHRRPAEWIRDPLTVGKATGRPTVLVTGATGFIGAHLVRRLVREGSAVLVLARDADRALDRFGPHVTVVTDLAVIDVATRIDAVVNLAGAPILAGWWTRRRREQLRSSRLGVTRGLVELAARLARPPRVLVSASAIGFYGVRGDEVLDERDGGQSIFQAQLCRDWEVAAKAAGTLGVRVVLLRFGLVLGRDGGALPRLALPVRLGLGSVLGRGGQWQSWIHIEDAVRLILHAIETPELQGPVNAVAPEPVTHRDFQRILASTLRRPLWLRVPDRVIRGALGEMAQLLVDGQRVVPARALASGFRFRFPGLGGACRDLLDPGHRRSWGPMAVYYNGECPVCRAEMTNYAKLCAAEGSDIRFIDSTQNADSFAAEGLRREHLEGRVYLRDARGRIVSGMPAIIALWSRVPGHRWLAKVADIPVIRPLTAMAYDHVLAPALAIWARNRRARSSANPVGQPRGGMA